MCSRLAQLCAVAGFLLPGTLAAQSAPEPPTGGIELDPASPLAPLPDIGVDWPDLAADTTTQAVAADTEASGEARYTWTVDGLDAVTTPLLRRRFDQLSTLSANDGETANAAQLDRRAREDAELLVTLLRSEGYYDAAVTTRIEPGARPHVVLEAAAGALYRFARVTVTGLAATGDRATGLIETFGIEEGAPADADSVVNGRAALAGGLTGGGFPFATVGEPDIVVDRAARTATLDLAVAAGQPSRFGRVVTAPRNRVFDARHVEEIARFRTGDVYDAARLDDLRRALIQTGLVSAVDVKPVAGSDPGTVDVSVRMDPAPPRTVAGELGYGTGEGVRAELSWTHRNLFPPEGGLTLRSVLGTREQLGAVTLRRNNFRGRDRVLMFQVSAAHTQRDAYDARTYSLSGDLERQTNIFFQKTWTWSLGGELLASDERDVIAATGQARRRTFLIAAAPTSLNYDGSDDLLNPTRGFRLGGRISPELSLQGSAFGYTRAQVDASAYAQVKDGVVLAGRTRLGTILGAPREQVAPSRRFYAGGGASVRGYGFQSIGPRDPNNDPIGGRSLIEFAIEARVRLFGNFGLVPFVDAGNISTAGLPDFSGLRYGAGLGLRYYSSFGPIRVDVGTPINPQRGDTRIAVYVSLGQAF